VNGWNHREDLGEVNGGNHREDLGEVNGWNHREDLGEGNGGIHREDLGEGMVDFDYKVFLSHLQSSFTSYDMGPNRLYFPSKGSRATDIYRP
jgi:hypothetical protein